MKNVSKEKVLVGPISINTKGVGFFDIIDKDSIEIQPQYVNRAFHGDTVEISLIGKKIKGREQGVVNKIINRIKTEFVGVVDKHDGSIFIIPDDKRLYVDIFLPKETKVTTGDKVLVKIVDWEAKNLQGKLLKVIGRKGENNTEMESIVLEKGFRIEFPVEVQREAEKIKNEYKNHFEAEVKNRKDMRSVTTMTIDPADAKDFDDAISFQDLGNNRYEIGVHIADVSYFVTPNTKLDKESEKRGLSVYLVDRTIPMLPEILSNDLCSLVPHKDRLTMSAVFILDKNTKVKSEWFGRTVIHSKKRFTYEEAENSIKKSGALHKELSILNNLNIRSKFLASSFSSRVLSCSFRSEIINETRPILMADTISETIKLFLSLF